MGGVEETYGEDPYLVASMGVAYVKGLQGEDLRRGETLLPMLKGFKRVSLEPGEVKEVEFTLFMEQLAFYDQYMRLVVELGVFEVMVGNSSEDIRLKGSFEVVGKTKLFNTRTIFFSEVTVK